MTFKYYLIFNLLFTSVLSSKVLIITYSYNNPEFIEMQNRTFKKFIRDDYEFVVFSDAPTEPGHKKIDEMCRKSNIKCIRVPQHIHEYPYYLPLTMPQIYTNHKVPSNVRHVHAIQYSLDTLGFNHDDVVFLIDSDMFLIRPLSISTFMQDCDIAAIFRGGVNEHGVGVMFCWPAVTLLNMKRLPEKNTLNFNCGLLDGCIVDSGGYTNNYLKAHPQLILKHFSSLSSTDLFCSDRFFPQRDYSAMPISQKIEFWTSKGFNEKEMKFLLQNPDTIEFIMNGSEPLLLHYRGGTNYEKIGESYHKNKKRLINGYFDDIINS